MKPGFVSLHPYFRVHPGKRDAIKAMLPRFVAKTATEKEMLFYEFSWNGDELFVVKRMKMPKASSHISRISARSWPRR